MRVNTRGLSPRSRIARANQRLKYTALADASCLCFSLSLSLSLSAFLSGRNSSRLVVPSTFVPSAIMVCHNIVIVMIVAIAKDFLTCVRCKARCVFFFFFFFSFRRLGCVVGNATRRRRRRFNNVPRHASFREIADSDLRLPRADDRGSFTARRRDSTRGDWTRGPA